MIPNRDERKFKKDQEVVVPQFLCNGNRLDVTATVNKYIYNKDTKTWDVEVVLHTCHVVLKEDRLVDSTEFWKEKNKVAV